MVAIGAVVLVVAVVAAVLLSGGTSSSSGAGTTSASGMTTTATDPAVMDLQRLMTRLGYYSGPIDGHYGPATTEAVKQLQTDLGLTADGLVGAETVAAFNQAVAAGTLKPTTTTTTTTATTTAATTTTTTSATTTTATTTVGTTTTK